MRKHADAAGLGASVRLRSADPSHTAAGPASVTQKETAGALQGTTAAIENQHLDFTGLEQSAPAIARRVKATLIHCAAWLALVCRGMGA